jgi:hypothetical protein
MLVDSVRASVADVEPLTGYTVLSDDYAGSA